MVTSHRAASAGRAQFELFEWRLSTVLEGELFKLRLVVGYIDLIEILGAQLVLIGLLNVLGVPSLFIRYCSRINRRGHFVGR